MSHEGQSTTVANDEHFRRLERMYASAPCNRYYSPRMVISHGAAEVISPIGDNLHHAAGAVHGSAYFKVMDDACFFAVNSLVEDVFVLTVSFTTYFTRPVSEGEMRAVGRVVHASRQLFVAEAVVYDSEDREIGRGSGTFVKSRSPLTAEIGYQ